MGCGGGRRTPRRPLARSLLAHPSSSSSLILSGFTAAGYLALTGDLPAAVEAWAIAHPVLAVPARAVVVFPIAYHYAGGLRHVWWDHAKHGAQAEHAGPLEKAAVDQSSYVVAGVAGVATLLAALA